MNQAGASVTLTHFSRAVETFLQKLKSLFVVEGITTEAAFDRLVWEAMRVQRSQRHKRIVPIRQMRVGVR
jgi:hypothetical protein